MDIQLNSNSFKEKLNRFTDYCDEETTYILTLGNVSQDANLQPLTS